MYKLDFQINNNDKNIGIAYLPKQDSINLPVIIYCHGWGGNMILGNTAEKLCEKALSNNFSFIAFDFYGCGKTGGNYQFMTYKRWKDNLKDIINWTSNQTFADKNKIGCYSISSGTTAALRCEIEENNLAFIISVATCISTHINMSKGGPAKVFVDNVQKLLSGDTVNILNTDFYADFYIDTISNAPIHNLSKIKCPVLFLQGTADNPFRIADARIGFQQMKYYNLSPTHIEIEGGNHCLDNVSEKAVIIIEDWLKKII